MLQKHLYIFLISWIFMWHFLWDSADHDRDHNRAAVVTVCPLMDVSIKQLC